MRSRSFTTSYWKLVLRFCALVIGHGACLSGASNAPAVISTTASGGLLPFPDATRYLALGDSITRGGTYHNYVNLFHVTRFPDRHLVGMNAGVSGDTAAGALRRLDWDVYPSHPDIVSVMFGMNDVGGYLYTPGREGAEADAARLRMIDAYEKNLRQLVSALRARGARPILITPSIYDETARIAAANNPGRNLGLGECAARVRGIASELDLPLVDFYNPMLELNRKLQQNDPAFTLIGKDRVHPGAPGHFVMAYHFLKALNAPGEVARIVIDARRGVVEENMRCELMDVRMTSGKVSFSYAAKSLPFPVEPAARPALDWVPFMAELNRETLSITGLAPGSWRLTIDGEDIRTYTAEELAAGVNLAGETRTPQYRQAVDVLELLEKRWAAISKLRDMAFVEHGAGRGLPHPLTLEQIRPKLDAWLATAKGKSYEGFFKKCAAAYLEDKPREPQFAAQADAVLPQVFAAAQPKPHSFTLTRD